ncbi:MAG: uroporphyrinogen decarboxylase family protein [Acidobacteriota bacterium]
MTPRERVLAALDHRIPDRVPRFEVWIDALFDELGQGDQTEAYVNMGQDCLMMPSSVQLGASAGKDGVDEWGRVWQGGVYVDGAVETEADLERFSPPAALAGRLFDGGRISALRARHPDHCLIYGSHIGPFMAAYMAMGFGRFFLRLADEPGFVAALLEARTEWCLAVFREAVRLGAEVLVLGDDAAHKNGPMISPRLWREMVLPCHRRIVREAKAPVVWHSDGNIEPLLPMAIEAGFAGIHGLEPAAGMDLARIKREYGRDLVLVGNIDVRVLCGRDLAAVRDEVVRCLGQGSPGGGYMISTCNSIFAGINPAAAAEMFRCEADLGADVITRI